MKRTELSGSVRERLARLPDLYQISRILSRREAVSSSAMEGTHSRWMNFLSLTKMTIRQGRRFDRLGITRWLWSGLCHRLS